MREILFRGKCLETGEWVYGFLERRPSPIQMQGYGGPWYIYVPPRDPDDNGRLYNINPETIGQYTGKADKNGKRIFEGDILKCVWDSVYNCFDIMPVNEQNFPHVCTMRSEALEVIGNIFDNPELLT